MSSSRDISHFIANLNSLDPVENNSTHIPHHDEELSIFSNTNFFDFDVGRSTDIAASVDDLLMQQERHLQDPKSKLAQHYLQQNASSSSSNVSSSSSSGSSSNGSEVQMISMDFSSLQQYSLASDLFGEDSSHHGTVGRKIQAGPKIKRERESSPSSSSSVQVDELIRSNKRRISSSESESPKDHDSKISAEEDKRRRNTAASARFRIKKKLREQEMERNTKELQSRVHELENRTIQLEMENKWLKNLVMEKNEARDMSELLDMKKKILGPDALNK